MPFPTAVDSLVDGTTVIHASQVQGVQRITVGPSWFNALSDENGVVDPTGVADSTAGLQAWVNRFSGTGANAVGRGYLPPGNYKVSGTISTPTTLQFGFNVQGAGRTVTTITQTTQNIDTLKITRGPGIVRQSTIRDLTIQGPNAGTSGFGINVEGEIVLERVVVTQCWTAVRLLNCFYGSAKDSFLGNSIQDGLFFDTGTTTWVGVASRYSGNGRYGIFNPGNAYDVRCFGDFFEGDGSRGIYTDGLSGTRFVVHLEGCYFETNSGALTEEVYIGPTALVTQANLIGCRFTDQPTGTLTHCRIGTTSSGLLLGNYFGDASGAGGKSLLFDAGAKGIFAAGNYSYLTPVVTAGAIIFWAGQILGQDGTPGIPATHIKTYGPAPTITGINAGISGTPTVSGNDRSGTITFITTAAGIAAGQRLFTVNFNTPYGSAPAVTVNPSSSPVNTQGYHPAAKASGSFAVDLDVAISAAINTYNVDYTVEEHN